MKATGIVRRIDDLGRVVIPKEIRRTLRIRESDPLEIFTDRDGEIILKKYSPIGELGTMAKALRGKSVTDNGVYRLHYRYGSDCGCFRQREKGSSGSACQQGVYKTSAGQKCMLSGEIRSVRVCQSHAGDGSISGSDYQPCNL